MIGDDLNLVYHHWIDHLDGWKIRKYMVSKWYISLLNLNKLTESFFYILQHKSMYIQMLSLYIESHGAGFLRKSAE